MDQTSLGVGVAPGVEAVGEATPLSLVRPAAAPDADLGDAERLHEARLVELGRLAAIANHELRQPLIGIKAFSEMIAEAPSLQPEVRDWARKIHSQSLRLERLVEGMRNLSRPSRPTRERLNFDVLAADVLGFAAFLFRHPNVRLSSSLSSAGACVSGSPDELHQVLLNLLANARDAVVAAGGGRVQVATICDGATLDVYIGDDGPGIDPACFQEVARGFHTTKADGLGLGLTVSCAIARRHAGSLELCAEPPPQFQLPVRTLFRLRLRSRFDLIAPLRPSANSHEPPFLVEK